LCRAQDLWKVFITGATDMGCGASAPPVAVAPALDTTKQSDAPTGDNADSESAEALCARGYQHFLGEEATKSPQQAAECFQKAADKGSIEAVYNLGVLYAEERGVPKDEAKAAKLFQQAADAGLAVAQVNLGFCFENGQGVEQDLAKAAEQYQKAASQDFLEGTYNLAWMYEEGRGVPEDLAKAVQLYEKIEQHVDTSTPLASGRRNTVTSANLSGHTQAIGCAMLALGVCYAEGKGVEKDEERAAKLYRKGANCRNAAAQYNLGVMTLFGQGGLAQDSQRAKVLFELAKKGGMAMAGEALDRLLAAEKKILEE